MGMDDQPSMRRRPRTRLLGACSLAAIALLQGSARGQESLPAIDVGGSSENGASNSSDGAPRLLTPQQARPDLQPDNVANMARVAPSSRPHTETFTRQDIEDLNPQNIFGLLQNATSVLVTYQGRKFPNNLKFRGDSNFGFVVDGAYMSAQTAGLMMQTLPLSQVDQVDIVRDPSALTLGPLVDFGSASGALNSGFVVIRTHIPQNTEAEFRTAVETYGGVLGSAYGGYVFDKQPGSLPTFISGFIQKSSNEGPPNFYAWNDTTAGLLKGGFSAGILETNWTLFQESTRYGFQQATFGQNTPSLIGQKWSYSPMEATFLTSNSNLNWDAHNVSLITLSYTKTQDNNVLAAFNNGIVTVNNEKSYTGQINARHSFTWDGTLAQLGIQYINWSNPTGQTSYAGYARKEDTLSGYGNFEQKLFSDRLTLDGSFRVDDHYDYIGVDQAASGSSTRYFYNRGFPLAINYAAGATLKPLKEFDLGAFDPLREVAFSGRYSHTEQSDVSGIIPDNGVTLLPELQDKYEAAVILPLYSWFKPQVTYFDTEIANDKTPSRYITYNGQLTPVWTQANTVRKGVEAVATGVFLDNPLGKTSYRASYTRLTEAWSGSTSTPYGMTIPRSMANFALTQAWNKFTATVAVNYVSAFWSNFNSADGAYHQVGNYATVDANLAYDFPISGGDAKLTFYGRNITNKRYETIYGYPAWGAVWGSELKLAFSDKSVADLPFKAAAPAEPSPAPFWTGFYAGVNAGGLFGDNNGLNNVPGDAFDDPGAKNPKSGQILRSATYFGRASASSAASVVPLSEGGFLGGGQIGYNWQFRPKLVAGLEADFQGTTAHASGSALGAANEAVTRASVTTTTTASKSLAYLGTARGRFGYLVTPALLAYATGGLAYGEPHLAASIWQFSNSASFGVNGGYENANSLRIGWTVGAGGEWLINPHWSAKLEYLYCDLGNQGFYGLLGGVNQAVAGRPLLYVSNVTSAGWSGGHVVRAGLNYHFDWGAAPQLAKY
ncbi:TonB-dependent receptor plug domain-containing protein [Methylocystis heyeri]|uniref:TonB-dependent receptor plug domain-containing protein n=1 Tax=Methylocystis heyeri TaxID=391905 RepID=A0A6B8KCU7_9HYPH|nr:TonB-dependent receptor plug domain-containing protein [Methylocystis heyeri]QGM44348.1 TonB-dependent receptor plug domain-containing protein [Methylocystis heyeri]